MKSTSSKEQAVLFGPSRSQVAVVTDPAVPAEPRSGVPAVVLINAGIVHRAGPNRLYTQVARHLASLGVVVARFDLSGIGDSNPRSDTLTYDKATIVETQQMMDWLADQRGARHFVLMGICSGAVTSFKTACIDPRVVGVGLLNAQGFDNSPQWNTYVQSRGWARSYLKKALFNPKSWFKAVTGRTQYRRLIGVLAMQIKNKIRPPKAVQTVAHQLTNHWQSLIQRQVQFLIVGSEFDHSQDYIDTIMGPDKGRPHDSVHQVKIWGADHTFTPLASQRQVRDEISRWIENRWSSERSPAQQKIFREANTPS